MGTVLQTLVGGSSQSLEGRGWDGKLHHDSPQASIPAGGGVGVVEEIGGEPLRASSSRARGWSRRISGFKVPEPPPRSLFPMSAIHKSNLIVRSKEETPGRGRKSACYAWPVSDLWASLSLWGLLYGGCVRRGGVSEPAMPCAPPQIVSGNDWVTRCRPRFC